MMQIKDEMNKKNKDHNSCWQDQKVLPSKLLIILSNWIL
jgi:hypothetical protein